VKAAEYDAAAPISATSNIFSDPTTANTALHAVPALIAALPGIETSVVRGVHLYYGKVSKTSKLLLLVILLMRTTQQKYWK
jgi:hypothetical protein